MITTQRLFWLLVLATGALYCVMLFWSLPRLAAMAGGLVPFDLRPLGYTPDEARALIRALGGEGKAFYLGSQHPLDTAFPALLASTLFLAFRRVAPRGWALAPGLVALAGAMFDYLENFVVHLLLLAGTEEFSPQTAEWASFFTVAKSAANSTAMTALAVMLALAAWRRWRNGWNEPGD